MNLRALLVLLVPALTGGCDSADDADAPTTIEDPLVRCHPFPERATEPARSQRSGTRPTDVVAWMPPPTPAYEGPLAINDALSGAARFGQDVLSRAEDIVFDASGRLYTGAGDGRIWRASVTPDGTLVDLAPFATTGGRPLGMAFDPCGNLIVAVPDRGVVAVSPDGRALTLTDRVNDTRIEFADEVTVARDGTVYVTDASTKYATAWPDDFLEGRPYGRVIAYEPSDGSVRVVASGLYFANGIVVSEDESHLLFAETWRGRVQRHWLTGEKAGQTETFAENLPVVPDNITRDPQGRIWITGQPRTPQLDMLSGSVEARTAFLRDVPANAPPPSNPHVMVVVLDPNGAVVQTLHDTTGSLPPLSSAVPHDRFLWLGTNVGQGVARINL